jgi:uncharacterized Ntn-hydrolase superfamily protein
MTYSIVARDPSSGALGVAVQSHFFGVGPVVPWLDPGVGAIATQATVNVGFGRHGLDLLRAGVAAEEAIARLIAEDGDAHLRQLAIVDATGRVAAHTGAGCIRDAGHRIGATYSVQGNLLRSSDVWPAMAEAFESTLGAPLWERLLAALDAGERAGGDVRGRQSAALVVVSGTQSEAPWDEVLMDVRVDDHEDPLGELRRLARMREAYRLMGEVEGPSDSRPVSPEAVELVFWRAIELARSGDLGAGRREMSIAFAADPTWREALRRVAEAGLCGDDPTVVDRLLEI